LAGHVHSKTIKEHVAAEVSLSASTTSTDTKTPIVFTGAVSPKQAGKSVALQVEQGADGTDWKTVATGKLKGGSTFSISHRFSTPGDRDVRVRFAGDARDDAAASDPVTVTVQQAQVAGFSIASSAPTITYGGSGATISGVLDETGTTTPDPGVSVTLWARTGSGNWKTVDTPMLTGEDGSYSFAVNPSTNTTYEARTTFTPRRTSAPLFLGVHDAITMTASATTAPVGTTVKFSGSVSPDKAGSAIYLERMGADGHWQIVSVKTINHASNYAFNWKVERTGTLQFRVRVPSDSHTLGVASAAASVVVTAPVSAS
jgi:hypothetical protein